MQYRRRRLGDFSIIDLVDSLDISPTSISFVNLKASLGNMLTYARGFQ